MFLSFSSSCWCVKLVFLLSFLPILIKQSSSLRASSLLSSGGDGSSDNSQNGDDGQDELHIPQLLLSHNSEEEESSRLLVGRTIHERQQELEVLSGIKVGTSVLTTVVDDNDIADYDGVRGDRTGGDNNNDGGGGNNKKKLRCQDGREYPLKDLKPYTELFSPDNFAISDDGTHVTNLRDGETFKNPVSRATYYHEDSGRNGSDVTVLQTFSTESEDGGGGEKLEFAEIRGSSSDIFFVNADTINDDDADDSTTGNTVSSDETLLLSFELNDIDISMLRENYHYGEGEEPPITEDKKKKKKKKGKKKGGGGRKDDGNENEKDKNKKKNKNKKKGGGGRHGDGNEDASDTRKLLPNFVYRRGDGTSAECTYFKVVNVAIVYDSDFCQRYGSFAGARNRIIAIVASASLYYERDMCVKLRLTDIYTPDANTCRAPSPTFSDGSFARGRLCGSTLPHMLYDFSRWMARTRRSLNINSKSLVHLMTGASPPSGTLGCAWLGTFCWDSFSYGVEHMNYSGSNIVTQSLILTHEVGHNLNAPHYESSSKEYVMEARLSRGTDGFSLTTARRIVSFLDTKTCDDVLLPPAPAPKPTKSPTKKPTPPTDTNNDCTDENGSSEACVFEGKKGAFACLAPTDILKSRFEPGGGGECLQSKLADFVLESCNGIPLKLTAPALGGGPITDEGELSNDGVGDENGTNYNENETSNDNPPSEEKKKGVCSRSCYVVGENVCLSAAKGSTHSIMFSARNSRGAMERFETTIDVEKNGSGCYEASTKCK